MTGPSGSCTPASEFGVVKAEMKRVWGNALCGKDSVCFVKAVSLTRATRSTNPKISMDPADNLYFTTYSNIFEPGLSNRNTLFASWSTFASSDTERIIKFPCDHFPGVSQGQWWILGVLKLTHTRSSAHSDVTTMYMNFSFFYFWSVVPHCLGVGPSAKKLNRNHFFLFFVKKKQGHHCHWVMASLTCDIPKSWSTFE